LVVRQRPTLHVPGVRIGQKSTPARLGPKTLSVWLSVWLSTFDPALPAAPPRAASVVSLTPSARGTLRDHDRLQRTVLGVGTKTFTDPRFCAAIADRFTYAGQIVETGTNSYRLANARRQQQNAKKSERASAADRTGASTPSRRIRCLLPRSVSRPLTLSNSPRPST
jgi:hypothetical protein